MSDSEKQNSYKILKYNISKCNLSIKKIKINVLIL